MSESASEEAKRPRTPPMQSSFLQSESESEVEQKFIFMFFSFHEGPIAYRLYAVKVPDFSLSLTCDPKRETGDIYSVVEFSSGKYRDSLTCVQLDSKFYLLGGSGDVFVIHAENIFKAGKSSVSADLLLEKGTPMNSEGRKDYIFVVQRKIYAVKSYVPPVFLKDFPPHSEVFDPDSDEWTSLPDPPTSSCVIGHAVKDEIIYIVTNNSTVFYLAPDNASWMPFSNNMPFVFRGKTEFVDDRLYGIHLHTLTAYHAPTDRRDDSQWRRCMMHLAPDVESEYTDHLIGWPTHLGFVHLGNQIFCLICTGCARDKDHPGNINLENLGIILIFFKAFNKTFTDDRDNNYFQADFLHSAHFVTKLDPGEDNRWTEFYCLHDCFDVTTDPEEERDKKRRKTQFNSKTAFNKAINHQVHFF